MDVSKLRGNGLLWDTVPVLEAMEQEKDAQGNYILRTNSRFVKKLYSSNCCVLEAIMFATGASRSDLKLSHVSHKQGLSLHELTVALRATPYSLYSWQALVRASGRCKRGRDGDERRRTLTGMLIRHIPSLPLLR